MAQQGPGIPEYANIFGTGAMTSLKHKKVSLKSHLVDSLAPQFGVGSGAPQTRGEGKVEKMTQLTNGKSLKYNAMLCAGALLNVASAGTL